MATADGRTAEIDGRPARSDRRSAEADGSSAVEKAHKGAIAVYKAAIAAYKAGVDVYMATANGVSATVPMCKATAEMYKATGEIDPAAGKTRPATTAEPVSAAKDRAATPPLHTAIVDTHKNSDESSASPRVSPLGCARPGTAGVSPARWLIGRKRRRAAGGPRTSTPESDQPAVTNAASASATASG
jgi:hypothetical protein